VLFACHAFESVNVSAALADCYANLTLVYNEYCSLLYFVNNAVFYASATYAFKQGNVSHFVAGNFYAGCHLFPPFYYS